MAVFYKYEYTRIMKNIHNQIQLDKEQQNGF